MNQGKGKASLLGATTIVIGNMIGIGVFTSLGFQVTELPPGFAILMLWAAGGMVAFCGAVCYAELIGMFPQSGGEYHLLRSAFHPLPGFLAGWVSMVAGFPAPVALAASAFGAYFSGSVIAVDPTVLGVGLILLVTSVHLVHVTLSSRFQSVATLGKALLILVFIICAFSVSDPQPVKFLPSSSGEWKLIGTGSFGVALLWVHYSYEGWNGAAYVAGEVRNPKRNVPRALLIGTGIVTILYMAINAAFLHVAPVSELAGQKDVGRIAANHIFGESGGRIMGGLISLGLISSISAMTWAGPRISARLGEDFRYLDILGKRSSTGIPIIATLAQSALAIIILLTAQFDQILRYVEALLLLSSTATVLGVIWLRLRHPEIPRPFKAFGFPVTPLLFVATTTYTLYWTYQRYPTESNAGILLLMVGVVLYGCCLSKSFQKER